MASKGTAQGRTDDELYENYEERCICNAKYMTIQIHKNAWFWEELGSRDLEDIPLLECFKSF